MQQELMVLEQNQTWDIVDLPKGKKAIGSKWVYKVKLHADGSVDRYKACLVAKGYNRVEGLIILIGTVHYLEKAVTVRTFLIVASQDNWPIYQVDINNEFLHRFLDEDIYMAAPYGYFVPLGKVCKLKKMLYGLKRVSRQWNLELTNKLISFGFKLEAQIVETKRFLDSAFTIKDLGHAKYFLGLEIACSPDGMSITQHKFVRDIIQDAGLISSKPASTPLPLGVKLSTQDTSVLPDPEPYRRLMLVNGILYFFWGKHSWKTKKQTTVARSTVETEYRCLGSTVCELQWISYLLRDFCVQIPLLIHLSCDNQAAIHIVAQFDVFTKLLPGPAFTSFLSKLSLASFPQAHLEGGMKRLQ
ncbi:Retrovirus-related Pol polyprotein from transposon RE1 [Sesamum angolense]|uniref:Retrovirus-related Pol polyprotein from transposon RE1 n=1 Tax=Sesamum angolense TaxID=2727404 RepID=A0AAE1X9R1_9LAMI|nr:Retrovirus-related Pol polyprotein from transposon RE1 [Sesamum angolense]